MYTESFHRLLKIVYLNSKQNRRVDKLLYILLRIARNLVYEQLRKVEKGKMTHRITEINKRHKSAIDIHKQSVIHKLKDGVWRINSLTKKDTFYTIEKQQDQCCCKLRCSVCDICMHIYSCTCIDATLHSTMCKHVHILQMLSEGTCTALEECEGGLEDKEPFESDEESQFSDMDTDNHFTDEDDNDHSTCTNIEDDSTTKIHVTAFNSHEYFSHVLHNDTTADISKQKTKAEDLAHNVVALL